MPKKSNTDFAIQKAAILGRLGQVSKDYELELRMWPQYIEDFPKVLKGIPLPLKWERLKFIPAAVGQVPRKFGVYCFSVSLGEPFPEQIHLPLYIGSASDQYLSDRFRDYLRERSKESGREKVVFMLNKYRQRLYFSWAEVPNAYVGVVEKHLLMCCKPLCNDKEPNRAKLWGKAFD